MGLTFTETHEADDGHKHEHGKDDAHNHEHGGILGENTELYFAIGSGVFWLTGLILSFFTDMPAWLPTSLFIGAFILGGYFTLLEAIETIRKGNFEIDFLMLVAAAGAAALGKWEEGALEAEQVKNDVKKVVYQFLQSTGYISKVSLIF